MTVAAQVPSVSIVATAGQTDFDFTFRCDDSETIVVYADDVEQGSPAIELSEDQDGSPGGTVTIVAQGVGTIVTVERVSPQTQTVDVDPYSSFPSSAIELALDKVVELLQEVWAALSRAPLFSRKNLTKMDDTALPAPVLGQVLGWTDAGGGKFNLGNVAPVSGAGDALAVSYVKSDNGSVAGYNDEAILDLTITPGAGTYLVVASLQVAISIDDPVSPLVKVASVSIHAGEDQVVDSERYLTENFTEHVASVRVRAVTIVTRVEVADGDAVSVWADDQAGESQFGFGPGSLTLVKLAA